MKTAIRERRRSARAPVPGPLDISVLRANAATRAEPVNLSNGGVCLRLEEPLEMNSVVRLQMTPERVKEPLECRGRVAWVTQRLDLRDQPPFLFDVGIEFLDPPPLLRRMLTGKGMTLPAGAAGQPVSLRALTPAQVGGRLLLPELSHADDGRWHLIVRADGVPCLSERYASRREALLAWAQFRRSQARRSRSG